MRLCLIFCLLCPVSLVADPARRDIYGDPLPEGAIQRLGTARLKHPYARGLMVSSDGRTIQTFGDDKMTRVWYAHDGALIRCFPSKELQELGFPFHQINRFVHLKDDHLEVMDLNREKLLWKMPRAGVTSLEAVVFHDDLNLLATVEVHEKYKEIRVWDLKRDTSTLVGHTFDEILRLAFHTKHRLSTDGYNGAFIPRNKLWDADGGGAILELPGSIGRSNATWSKSGYAVVMSRSIFDPNPSATWRLWDLVAMQPTSLKGEAQGETYGIDLNQNFKWCLSHHLHSVQLHNLQNHQTKRFDGSRGAEFSPDGRSLFLLHHGLKKIDLASGRRVWGEANGSCQEIPLDLFWTADATRLVVVRDSDRGRFDLFNVGRGFLMAEWDTNDYCNPTSYRSMEGEIIATNGDFFEHRLASNGGIRKGPDCLNGSSSSNLGTRVAVNPEQNRITAVSFEPDVTSIRLEERDLESWEARTKSRIELPNSVFGGIDSVAISQDARVLQYGEKRFRLPDCIELPEVDCLAKYLRLVHLTPDASLSVGCLTNRGEHPAQPGILTLGDLRVWERTSGASVFDLDSVLISAMAIDSTGRFLATAQEDGIRVWDLRDGRLIRFICLPQKIYREGRLGFATCLAFSRDGKKLASGHPDTTVLIWDVSDLPSLPKQKLTLAEIQPLWEQLRRPDAKEANTAIWKLVGSPETVMPFLKQNLQPIQEITVKQIVPLLGDLLEPTTFRKRESTIRKLEEMSDAVVPPLRELLEDDLGDPEVHRRLKTLTERRGWSTPPTGIDLQMMRAVRLLELIGGEEALKQVEKLSEGFADARATQEAVAARARMKAVQKAKTP